MEKSLFVLFGATGSLAREKIIPALKKVHKEDVEIVLYGRRDFETDFPYIKGELNDISRVVDFAKEKNITKIYFYISLPPTLYPEILNSISKAGENIEKIIALEKPFGTSLKNAEELSEQLRKIANSKIYLIDHYLAKEPVIEINPVDINKVKNIKIAILETVDVSTRGEFFDALGALKDVGQNHMLNMLSKLLGGLENVHYKKGSLKTGQYKGYLETKGVKENSETETYFKADFILEGTYIDIEFEAGKRMDEDSGYLKVEYLDGSEYKVQIKPSEKPIVKEAHEYIIEDIISGEEKFAVSINQSLTDWKIIEEVLADKPKTKVEKY